VDTLEQTQSNCTHFETEGIHLPERYLGSQSEYFCNGIGFALIT